MVDTPSDDQGVAQLQPVFALGDLLRRRPDGRDPGLHRHDQRRSAREAAQHGPAGPGAIATVTALMGKAGRVLFAIPVIASIAVTCAASYAMLVAADRIQRLMGVTGISVMNRVIGLIIGAIAVQFMFDGLRDTFPGVLH